MEATTQHVNELAPTIELIHDATVLPISKFKLAGEKDGSFNGGVFDAGERIVASGLQMKSGYQNVPGEITGGNATAIGGFHLFGGMLQNEHFGHFITESVARLWAIPYLSNLDSIVFYARHNHLPSPSYLRELLDLLSIDVPVTVVRNKVHFENLFVPVQQCWRSTGTVWGTRTNRALFRELHKHHVRDSPKNIYISRSDLSPRTGGFLASQRLKAWLEQEGYFAIHPEKLSLKQQVELYNGAERLIFDEGSALHLYALMARPDQRGAIIQRRLGTGIFRPQIRSFTGADTMDSVSAIKTLWVPNNNLTSARTELDFDSLRMQLENEGFVSGESSPRQLATEVRAELDELEAKNGWLYQAVDVSKN